MISPRNKDTGKWGEDAAAQYLAAQGYAIVTRNWTLNHLELDIVASKDDMLVFVEVKTRKSGDVDPVRAVNQAKRQHIIAAADAYLQMQNIPLDYRFDIIAITGTREQHSIEHIPNAFYPTLKKHGYSFRL